MNKIICFFLIIGFFSCKKDSTITVQEPPSEIPNKAEGWSKESHSNDVPPDYGQVIPDAEVRSITIHVGKTNWANISYDMLQRTARYFGNRTPVVGITPPAGNGSLDAVPGDPIWVDATIEQGKKKWIHVGFRLKGNASLSGSWQSGIYKLPFKLKFDEYEDKFTDTKDQRFFGFKELSFAPCFGDNTFMKDKLVGELFREGGIPTAKSAFYKVYIDFGQGVKYCGVYNMIEVIDDTFIDNQYGSNNYNVYKPETDLLTFQTNLYEKQNNKTAADYSDVIALVNALNSPLRLTNTQKWLEELEARCNVDHFLKYLAINNTIANWDSYGVLKHNYYFVTKKNRIHWVPYDLNLSMQLQGGLNNSRFALSFEMKEITAAWPLIRYLIDQPDYYARYKYFVKEFATNVYIPNKIDEKIDKYTLLIKPFVNGIEPEQPFYSHLGAPQNFENSIAGMKSFIRSRKVAVEEFVK
jgi:spore coat protein H